MSLTSQTTRPPPSLLLRRHLAHLSHPLMPLHSVTTGFPHPSFPRSILHYHVLTEVELDSLAHFYHQSTPTAASFDYPVSIVTRWDRAGDVKDKRRRLGRFLGLRGCESPINDEGSVERWVDEMMRRGLDREIERETWRSKGFLF